MRTVENWALPGTYYTIIGENLKHRNGVFARHLAIDENGEYCFLGGHVLHYRINLSLEQAYLEIDWDGSKIPERIRKELENYIVLEAL